MTGGNLLGLAREKGSEAFFNWFRERLGISRVEVSGLYTAGDLYEALLDVRLRSYQYWEEMADFPVKAPYRLGKKKTSPRVYTVENVVDVAYWYYLRKLRLDADTFTVSEIADMLFLPVETIMYMMASGQLPGTGQDVSKEEYQRWLHGKVLFEEEGGLVVEG